MNNGEFRVIETSSESEYWRGLAALCSIPSCQPTTWWEVHRIFLVKLAGERPKTKLPGNYLLTSAQKARLSKPLLPPGFDRRPQVEAIQFVSSELGRLEDQFREQPLKINMISQILRLSVFNNQYYKSYH